MNSIAVTCLILVDSSKTVFATDLRIAPVPSEPAFPSLISLLEPRKNNKYQGKKKE